LNYNKQVVFFTISLTLLLLSFSIPFSWLGFSCLSFENISVVSDLFKDPNNPENNKPKNAANTKLVHIDQDGPIYTLENYKTPNLIMHFGAETSKPALPKFMQALYDILSGKKTKLRIGWFGDSIIEGDLMTQTFRKRIQTATKGFGVGFVAMQSITAKFRTSVYHQTTGNWAEDNFRSKHCRGPLFLSGHTWYTSLGSIKLRDATIPDTDKVQLLYKTLLCGQLAQKTSVLVNGQTISFNPAHKFNAIPLDQSTSHYIDLKINTAQLPVYGVSIEPSTGVVVDNLSFRGITGLELAQLDSAVLRSIDEQGYYNLIILEYGVNLMFRAKDMEYNWYYKNMGKALAKLRRCMPNTEFLLISTTDRAFRYQNNWSSAIGIENLVYTQAQLAAENNFAFYNIFESMGGPGTIVSWANQKPSLANQDYIHPNHRGAERLGNLIFEDFMKDLKKLKTQQKP
jgi:lysophospholipase L1-like esterase